MYRLDLRKCLKTFLHYRVVVHRNFPSCCTPYLPRTRCIAEQHQLACSLVHHCTDVRFASLLSGGFTTMAVINPPEKKLAKRTSVQCCVLLLFFVRSDWMNFYFRVFNFEYWVRKEIPYRLTRAIKTRFWL